MSGMFLTEGFDDLQHDLLNMAEKIEYGSGVDRALKAGAVPIHNQMKANTSSDPRIITGALNRSIKTHKVKRSGKGKQITIGVSHSEESAYYANPVEFGHGGPAPAPAHPFVRPAYDTQKDNAYAAIKAVLRDEISKL